MAWGAKLFSTSVLICSLFHLCPCYGLGLLWLFLSVTEQTPWLSGLNPLTYGTRDIIGNFHKSFKNHLCSYNASCRTNWYKSSIQSSYVRMRMYICCLEYSELVFLEIQNVTIWSVFLNPVTYCL